MWFFPFLFLCVFIVQYGKTQDTNVATNSSYSALQELTQFRRQYRKTIDGRLCAAAFVQDGVTYTDCTIARAPNGNTGREWCFIEVQELGKGPRDWQFCSPQINYDKVRSKAREAFELKVAEAEKMVERMDGEAQRLEDMKHRYNATCGMMHEGTGDRLAKMEELLSCSQQCLAKVQESTSKIKMLESSIEQIQEDTRKVQKKLLSQAEYCGLVPGYEDDPVPDGIRGTYYNNPFFKDAPRAFRDDKKIDFIFSGKGPIEGITAHKYSIRWEGYLLAPSTGSYTFITETTCGARMFLSDRVIIVDRMPVPSLAEKDTDLTPIPIIPATKISGIHRVVSTPQQLIGGKKYKIRIEMIHSGHLKFKNPEIGIIRLKWKPWNEEEQIIPSDFYYHSNPTSSLKISGLDANIFDISLLYNGERAFKDSSSFVLADIPPLLEKRKMIRTVSSPSIDRFQMSINEPCIVYIASPANDMLPLAASEGNSWKARDSLHVMSVYKQVLPMRHAISSSIYKIWFVEMKEGGEINFVVVHKGQPFILFVEPKKESESTCGGEEEVLSITDGPYFESCDASTQASDDFGCRSGLNGRHMDQRNGIWRTAPGTGVGESLVVKFKKDVQITQFRFKPRDDGIYAPSEITLRFSEGGPDDEQVFNMMHVNSLLYNSYELARPVITKFVKAEITRMYMSGEDSGGSFEFIGTPCATPEQSIEHLPEYQEITISRCDTALINLPEILPLEEGQQFIAVCPSECIKAPEGVLHGVSAYSVDSTICLASVHAGVCTAKSHPCRTLVTVGGKKDYFEAKNLNGITSLTRGSDDASYTVAKAPSIKYNDEGGIVKYAITFIGNSSARFPEGYLVDNGQIKKERKGLFYGWLRPAKVVDCNASVSSNILNTGGISFPPSRSSDECVTKENCEANFWSISIPENGNYLVEVQLGNPCFPIKGTRSYFLQINGLAVVNGITLAKAEYHWVAEKIEVSDNRIVLTSVCDSTTTEAFCENAITTLMNVKIQKLNKPLEPLAKFY